MKKIAKNFFVLAVGALVAVSMTSCHHSSESAAGVPGESVVEKVVPLPTSRTLIVNLDAPLSSVTGATLKYNGNNASSVSGNTYTFNNVADNKKVVLEGGNVIKQEANVSFGDKTIVVLSIVVKEKSAGTVITPASGAEDDDQIDAQAKSTITLSSTAVTNNPSLASKNLAVTMFSRLQPLKEDVKKGDKVEVAPYTIDCEPAGATFNPAVDVKTELPGADGCQVSLKGPNGETPEQSFVGTTLTAKLSHFSAWDIFMFLDIVDYQEAVEVIKDGNLQAGTNTISYAENAGYSYNENEVKSSKFILRALNAMFGAENTKQNKTVSISATAAGTYTISQNVEIITLSSGTRTFTIKVWGEVTCTTKVSESAIVTPTHSGGSND